MTDKTSIQVKALIRRLGYSFHDPSLVNLALTHRSIGATNNERMEFLGDSIVNFVIGEALFQKFPQCREGDLSQMRAQLVKGTTLAEIAKEFEVGDCLNLGVGELKSGGFRRESILADALEALIGAIYIDGGMDSCRLRILQWYDSRLELISPEAGIKDAKSRLQELLQSKHKELPVYHVVDMQGSDHQQTFSVEVEIVHLKSRFCGSGGNRRVAEQAAAAQALAELLGSS